MAGTPAVGEGRVVVEDPPPGAGGERVDRPHPPGRVAQEAPQARVGAGLARDREVLVGHEVDDHDGRELVGVARRVGLAAAQPVPQEGRVGRPGGALLAVEHHEADLAVARAAALRGAHATARARWPRRPRRRWRRRSRGCPWCRSAPRPGSAARARADSDHVAQAAGHRLEAAPRQPGPQALGQQHAMPRTPPAAARGRPAPAGRRRRGARRSGRPRAGRRRRRRPAAVARRQGGAREEAGGDRPEVGAHEAGVRSAAAAGEARGQRPRCAAEHVREARRPVAEPAGQVGPADRALGVVEDAERVDDRAVGEDAGLEDRVRPSGPRSSRRRRGPGRRTGPSRPGASSRSRRG